MKRHALTVISTLILLICLSGCAKANEIDAKTLVTVGVNGFNGKGNMTLDLNRSNVQTIVDEIKNDKDSKEALQVEMVLKQLNFGNDAGSKHGKLSNGDEVKIKVNYSKDDAKKAKISFTNTEFTYTVSGLSDLQTIDPFAEIELVYTGISPKAKVTVANRSEKQFVRDLEYKCSQYDKLRIGDKIVVTVDATQEESESQGYVLPDSLSKEYTVEGIDEYLTNFNDLDDATKVKMKKDSSDYVESSLVGVLNTIKMKLNIGHSSTKIDTPELYKIYFNTMKQGGNGDSANDIFYVYKITGHKSGETEPRIGYIAVLFSNAVKHIDGTISFDSGKSDYIFYSSISNDWDITYDAVVNAKKANYEIQEITP